MDMNDYVFGEIISGYTQLIQERADDGWSSFLMTFMFKPGCPRFEMQDEIDRVYSTFVTRAVRRPHSRRGREERPILVTCLDAFSLKLDREHSRRGLSAQQINDGKHHHGILAMNSESRLRESVPQHFATAERLYVKGKLLHINVRPIDSNVHFVVDYALKALKTGEATFDDVLVFPKAASEQTTRSQS
jgi:hypothetical protein